MKKFFLLAAAVVALICSSTYSRADSMDYAGAGAFSDHTAIVTGSLSVGGQWSITIPLVGIEDLNTGKITSGILGFVTISTGKLYTCENNSLCFTAGSIDIDSNNKEIYQSVLSGGEVQDGTIFLTGSSPNSATMLLGANGVFTSSTIVNASPTPEVSSIALLGAGLCTLAGLRKLIA